MKFGLGLRVLLLFSFSTNIVYAGAGTDILWPGETLSRGQFIRSPNGKYTLTMQSDGRLAMYRNDGSLRYSMAKHGNYAVMQQDGNFVQYNGSTPLWESQTAQRNLVTWRLRIYDNGDLQVGWNNSSMVMVAWGIGPDFSATAPKVYPMANTPPPGVRPTIIPQFIYADYARPIGW